MMRKALIATALALVFVAASASVGAQVPTTSVSAETDGTVNPGGQATVNVSAESAGSVSIEGVPSAWEVSSSRNGGAFISPDELGDNTDQGSVLWAWEEDRQSLNVSVTFGVPADAREANYTLEAGAERRDGMTDNDSVVIAVQVAGETGDDTDGEDDGGTDGGTEDDGTDADDGEEEGEGEDGRGGEGMPGFGPVVAVVAVLCGGALRSSV